jgi:hypothetical protein
VLKQSRAEYLQQLADSLRTPEQYQFSIEFRGRGGWFAVADERRHFCDNGEFLGYNWQQAEKTLRTLLG